MEVSSYTILEQNIQRISYHGDICITMFIGHESVGGFKSVKGEDVSLRASKRHIGE